MNSTQRPGFILVSTFMMLTIAIMMIMQVFYKGSVYNISVPVFIKREKAKKIALSGVQVAISQLALYDTKIVSPREEYQEEKDKKKPEAEENRKNLLKTLLYVQNRWQMFELDEDKDGIEGSLGIYITCEQGKIPMDRLLDFKKKEFIKTKRFDGKAFFKYLFEKLQPYAKGENLFSAFESILKNSKYRSVDPGQFLETKQFKVLRNDLFLIPPLPKESKQEDEESPVKPKVGLYDIFSVWNDSAEVDPLLFSPSVKLLFGIKQDLQKNPVSLEMAQDIVDKFPFSQIDWEKEWEKSLQSLYHKDYKNLPKEVLALLSSKFEPRHFSVVCYGKVGTVKQKLVALIERSFTNEGEIFNVRRVYWL